MSKELIEQEPLEGEFIAAGSFTREEQFNDARDQLAAQQANMMNTDPLGGLGGQAAQRPAPNSFDWLGNLFGGLFR